jgi:hypothetical protein
LVIYPREYHWGAVAVKKFEFVDILNCLLRHIQGTVGDDHVEFVNFYGGAESVTASALEIYCAWKLVFFGWFLCQHSSCFVGCSFPLSFKLVLWHVPFSI